MLAKLICVLYYFTLFTHNCCSKIKINSVSSLKRDNYVSITYMKDFSSSFIPEAFELWVFNLHSKNIVTVHHR